MAKTNAPPRQRAIATASSGTAGGNRYLDILEHSPSMIFVNQRDRVVFANTKCEELMGYTREEFYSPSFQVVSLMTPESARMFGDNYAKQQQGSDIPPCEYTLVTKSGARIDTIITTKLFPYEGDTAILGIVTDISENKWIENERNRYMEHLSFLSRSAMHFVKHKHDVDIFRFIVDHLKPLTRGAIIAVCEYPSDKRTLTIKEIDGDPASLAILTGVIGKELKGLSFFPAKSIRSMRNEGRLRKLEEGAVPLCRSLLPSDKLHILEHHFGPWHLYHMPLAAQGEVLGSALLLTPPNAPLAETGLLEAFINQAAIAVKQSQSVEALRRREQEFRALAENSTDIIFRITPDLRLAYGNPATVKMTAIPLRNFRHKPFRELGFSKENITLWEDAFHSVFSTAAEKTIEFSFETPAGLRYYHTRIMPEFSKTGAVDSLLAIARDISFLKSAEEKLRRSAGEWRTTFDAISDLISIRDSDLRIVRVNRAFAAAYHAVPEELIGRHCYEICRGAAARCPGCLQPRVLSGKQLLSKEFQRQGAWYEETISPVFGENGEIVFTIHIDKDITERKRAEEILKRDKSILEQLIKDKTEELIGAQKKLEDVRRLSDIGILAATIAHEIRNPLAAIKTAAYNLRRKSPNSPLEHHIKTIDKKVDESDQIIKNLLSYSRIKLPSYEWIAFAGLLTECIASAAEKYAKWNVQVIHRIECGSGDIIEADLVHLKALFTNILDNAYQAMPEKKGLITVTAHLTGDTFFVSFRDNGTGIDGEDLARITEPFFTRKSRGTGLGLTVCTQIVHLHNGTIAFESEKNKGTRVTITLPVRRPSV